VRDVLAAALHAAQLAGGAPNPGTGTLPPGTGGLLTILRWAAGVVSVVCVGGILFVAGRMALQHQRGEAGQHMSGLGWVLAACILVASASALVGALI
jgi:hypothetical protein